MRSFPAHCDGDVLSPRCMDVMCNDCEVAGSNPVSDME